MENIIQQCADKCISEINHHIDSIIDMQLNIDIEGDDFQELTLKVKQQILFTLIKQVTK
jgi:hypothetical protein